MSEAFWTTIAVIVGTILAGAVGAAIPLLGQRAQRKHEREQWYAEFFLRLKVDTLTSLYTQLATVQRVTNSFSHSSPDDYEKLTVYIEHLRTAQYDLVDKANSAYPYQSKTTASLLQALIDQMHRLHTKLAAQLRDQQPVYYPPEEHEKDRKEVFQRIDALRKALVPELNPALLARIQNTSANIDHKED